jgi:heterodisulfide reductase subunit A-like polyferredoxin
MRVINTLTDRMASALISILLMFAITIHYLEASNLAPIRRIAVVGGGIAGLSFSAAVNQLGQQCDSTGSGVEEITVFESRSTVQQGTA